MKIRTSQPLLAGLMMYLMSMALISCESTIGGIFQASSPSGNNLQTSIDILENLNATLERMTELAIQIRTGAIYSANGTLNEQDRQIAKERILRLLTEMARIRNEAESRNTILLNYDHPDWKPEIVLIWSDRDSIKFALPVLSPGQFFLESWTPVRTTSITGDMRNSVAIIEIMDEALEALIRERNHVLIELELLYSPLSR